MFELIYAGGWLMVPIIICSVLVLAIVAERIWYLQSAHIAPDNLVPQVLTEIDQKRLSKTWLEKISTQSALGKIFHQALSQHYDDKEGLTQLLQQAGRHVVHDLEKYLNTLGTIAAIAPLLGLLGTVVGMIDVFSTMVNQGVGNAQALAGGISQALITTAAGLSVAIPALIAYRFIARKVDAYTVALEQESRRFVGEIAKRRLREIK